VYGLERKEPKWTETVSVLQWKSIIRNRLVSASFTEGKAVRNIEQERTIYLLELLLADGGVGQASSALKLAILAVRQLKQRWPIDGVVLHVQAEKANILAVGRN
jgi:hypothetical protein